jgi:hypothetical protein
VKRWYERFRKINEGVQHVRQSDEYQDDVYAFFLNCHHLKDWIKNDESVDEATKNKVEGFIETKQELKICADICNGLKHLKLTRQRSGLQPRFAGRLFKLSLGGSEPTISIKFSIETERGPIDAFQVATKCLEAWTSFIQLNIESRGRT